MSVGATPGADAARSHSVGRGRGKGRYLIPRGVAVILLLMVVAGGRKLWSRPGASAKGSDPGSDWSQDLAEDRRFERSLIPREIAVILLIGLLIVARELLS